MTTLIGQSKQGERRIVRYISIAVIFAVICFVFVLRLVNYQLIEGPVSSGNGDEEKTYEREVRISAVRGQIYDCNGVPLVVNSYKYDMYLYYDAMPFTRDRWNETLLHANAAIEAAQADGQSEIVLPENLFFLDGTYNDDISCY